MLGAPLRLESGHPRTERRRLPVAEGRFVGGNPPEAGGADKAEARAFGLRPGAERNRPRGRRNQEESRGGALREHQRTRPALAGCPLEKT